MPTPPRRAVALVALALMLFAAAIPARAEQEQPNEVTIGILVNRIDALSLKESTFDVDFYIWFVWSNRLINPGESFEITNGRINSKLESDIHEVDGGYYASYRMHATIIKEFDLYKYPRDRHRLTIEFEDATPVDELVYKLDARNSKLNRDFFAPGFVGENPDFTVVDHVYNTNYGDPDLATDNESVYLCWHWIMG